MRWRNWLNSTRTTGEVGRAEDLRENTDNYATIIWQRPGGPKRQYDWTGDSWGQGQNDEYPDVGQLRIKTSINSTRISIARASGDEDSDEDDWVLYINQLVET